MKTDYDRNAKRSFDRRYGKNWTPGFLFIAHSMTGGKCCYCWAAKSEELHHARYRDERGAIAGREIIGVDVFPVCGATNKPGTCHWKLHRPDLWIEARNNPALNNRNTAAAIDRLRTGYAILSASVTPLLETYPNLPKYG